MYWKRYVHRPLVITNGIVFSAAFAWDAGPKTGLWEITPGKSLSVYECIHFTWPYNAHPGLLAQPYMYW